MADYKAIAPQAAGYNAFSNALPQSYANTKTGVYGIDIAQQVLLEAKARREQQAYMQAVQAANASQLQGQAGADAAENTRELYKVAPQLATHPGYMRAFKPLQDMLSQPELATAEASALSRQEAAGFADKGAAINNIAPHYNIPPAQVGQILQGSGDQQPIVVQDNPDSASKLGREKAISDRLDAQAHMVDAQKPNSSGSGGGAGLKLSYTSPDGSVKATGPASQVQAYKDSQEQSGAGSGGDGRGGGKVNVQNTIAKWRELAKSDKAYKHDFRGGKHFFYYPGNRIKVVDGQGNPVR